MVANAPTSTVDLNRSRMTLRDDLVFVPQPFRGQTYYHIEARGKSAFYRIGYAEYAFISLLDGNTTFAEALALSAQQMGTAALTSAHAMKTYLWLLENKLGRIDAEVDAARYAREPSRRNGKSLLQHFNPFWLKLPLGKPDWAIKALVPYGGWIFSPLAGFVGISLIIVAMAEIALHWGRFWEASAQVFSPSNWLWMGLTWIGLKIVHELAHGIASRRLGSEVKEVGLVFILLAPMAYIDVTASWRLPSKWHRMQIAAAGMYVELVIAAIATFLWLQTDTELVSHLLFNLILMASISTVAFNANPLMRFDGYFILSDLLEIPNLYAEGSKAVARHARRLFFGQVLDGPQQMGAPAWFIGVYGWAAALWRILICISLALVASVLFEGAGIVIAAFGVISWYGPPLVRLLRELADQFQTNRATSYRAAGCALALAACLLCGGYFMPTPFRVSAPGIIEHRHIVHLRSLAPGFVRQVLVRDGQHVNAGDLLMVLENRDVSNIYHDLLLSIRQTQLRRRVALDEQRIALAQVEQRNLLALEERLVKARRRYEALEVRAPSRGKVMRRSLANLQQTFVQEGETLLSIANEDEKEVIVFVAQEDFDNVIPAVGSLVQIRHGALNSVDGRLVRVEPRASVELRHQALAATEGGPLTIVELEGREGGPTVELTEPRFRGVVSVPPKFSDSLFSGQRCQVMIGWHREKFAVWLRESFRNWMNEKLSQ